MFDLDTFKEQLSLIIFIVLVILGLLVLFSIFNINFNQDTKKKVKKVVIVEAYNQYI